MVRTTLIVLLVASVLTLFISGCVKTEKTPRTVDEFCELEGYNFAWPDECVKVNYVLGRLDVPKGLDGDPADGDDFFDEVLVNNTDICPVAGEGVFCAIK